eukprot:Protomagalhaensia_wolfi_Nauph_80__573@NODE_1324_length_1588_cov_134_064558_g1023_i0_p1_GENE_NODE_1324_length_1588_cov_134_064558_g1023_i0NODE_1324_length_1588_cov_134_064558_g1023_i0_p1_ORF_typecomplete_len293_score47_57MAT1/PF06391_13/1_7e18zfRING_5/PF14634_6/8_9e06zfRING_UBOX/PF13445_6/0_0011zfC3HC4_5/PF17121_5/0_0022zfC3HC4/PF00097_25/0_0061zfRING_2/PF13639_6/0_022zfC3HC4_2/PF13923_6/0_013zfC3HC4_3/PF13920_6/0_33zfRING_4/PF14570_6/6_5zfRING_4/PF14570_6/61ProkRING_4/PF14447_6/41ProkRING_4/PF14
MEEPTVTKVCPVCREDYLTVFEVKLFRSGVCGHPVCSRCLTNNANGKLSKTGQWIDLEQVLKCLVCGVPAAAGQWTDTAPEENLLEKEALVRARVLAILNGDRKSYQNTPAYNQFLEEREEIIYDLVFSDDDSLKAQRQTYLKQYEMEFQQQILEASERQRLREKQWIQEIVEKEDVFYEIVNQGFAAKNFGFKNTDRKRLVHKLQHLHPQYFEQADAVGVVAGPAQASDVSITKLSELHASLPNTIIPNIDYMKLKRRHADDRAALLRAGGHKKDRIAVRTRLEAFALFQL